MTSHHADGPRPIDARQIDSLNRYIDGLAAGVDRPSADLDPRLVAAVRSIHGPDAHRAGSMPGRADEDRLWRDLMQLRPRPELRALPRNPSAATTLPPLTGDTEQLPVKAGRRQPRPTDRLRHIGGRTLGLVATFIMVALVTLSGLAVWLSAPDERASPTSIAGIGATPPEQHALVAVDATPDSGAADLVRPVIQACDVVPRTMDDAISTIARPFDSPPVEEMRQPVPSRLLPWRALPGGGLTRELTSLPVGSPVDQTTMEAVSLLYGEWLGCRQQWSNYSLTAIALLSDDGVTRLFWRDDDQEPNAYLVVRLASPGPLPREQWLTPIGQPASDYLWGFRTLTDGRIAAYVARNSTGIADLQPSLDETLGVYVVFVPTQTGWEIDELSGPYQG